MGIVADLGAKTLACAQTVFGECFPQIHIDGVKHRHTKPEQQPEICLPSKRLIQHAADAGANHRHDRHAHSYISDHAGGLIRGHHVADHGARQHQPYGHHRLRHARGQKPFGRWGHKGANRCQTKKRKPPQQHGPAAVSVRQRADDDLQCGTYRKIKRNGQLHHCVVRPEVCRHCGQRGQKDVHRQRRDACERDEGCDVGSRTRWLHGKLHDFALAGLGQQGEAVSYLCSFAICI